MTLANAKVLYAHFLEIGRKAEAEDLERRYPELKKPEPKPEVRKSAKKPKR